MNERERFNAAMHYQARDRSPVCDFGFWDETLVIWRDQGLPEHINRYNSDAYFGMDTGIEWLSGRTGVKADLKPLFDEVVLEDRGDYELLQQDDGVRVLRQKFLGSIPLPISHLLTDRESWRKHFLPRLDPSTPSRFPPDLEERVRRWNDPQRHEFVALSGGGLYGRLRNWMGMENLSYVVYDDPAWFEEMVETLANLSIALLTRLLQTGAQFDACSMWEDMAYNAGPLLSPKHFRKYLMPHYRRIADLVRSYGVDVIWLDCDGNIDALLPLWLEAGINCMFPVEVGTWHADPLRYRKQYGKELLMLGGFDKHILASSKAAIRQEVERLAPLVEEGGFIGFCDHRVPPDVSLDNYRYYLKAVREVWGCGVNLNSIDW